MKLVLVGAAFVPTGGRAPAGARIETRCGLRSGSLRRCRAPRGCGSSRVCLSLPRSAKGCRLARRGCDRWPKRPPGQPPACSLAAFEPSLHFVDVVHAMDDDAAGRGRYFILEGTEAGADVDAPFDGSLDGLRVHVVCPVSCGALSPYCPVGRARAAGQGRSRRWRRLAWRVLARPTLDARARLTGVGQGGERAGRVRIVGDGQGRRGGVVDGSPRESGRLPAGLGAVAACHFPGRRMGADWRERGSDRRQNRPSSQSWQGS